MTQSKSENLPPPESKELLPPPSPEREHVIFLLVEDGLTEIERRYGPDGLEPKPYHNANHTRDVIDAAIQLADAAIETGKIKPKDKDLLILAACYHDFEHGLGSGLDEAESARYICGKMRESGYFSNDEIAEVYKMIMATQVYFIEGQLHQSAAPDDIMTQLMADADLSTLGKSPPIYWDRARRYLAEVSGRTDAPTAGDLVSFSLAQDSFLCAHQFYTEEARHLFPYHDENIAFTRRMQRFWASRHHQS